MSVNYYNNGTLKNISGGGGGAVSYTTEEVPTGGTWVDGKPIYRKVITTAPTLTSSSGIYTYDFAETITGVETVVEMKGFFNSNTSTTNGYFLPLPEVSYYDQAHMIELVLYEGIVRLITKTQINLSTTSSWQVIIEYTKIN